MHLRGCDERLEQGALREALELLQVAAGGEGATLGPMPRIVMLPALMRLRDFEPDAQRRESIDREIKATLHEAIRATGDLSRHTGAARGRSGSLALRRPDNDAASPVAQGPVVNMLELAVYFLGAHYGPLRGLRDPSGDPCEGLLLGEAFVLVGHRAHSDGRSVRLPRETARRILEASIDLEHHHLVFELPAPRQGSLRILHAARGVKIPQQFDALQIIGLLAAEWQPPSVEVLQ